MRATPGRVRRVVTDSRKALAALAAGAAYEIAAGTLHGGALQIASVIIAVAGVVGVYAVPNTSPPPPAHAADRPAGFSSDAATGPR